MIQKLEKPVKRLVELRAAYGVRRRADGDYSATVFRCPTNGRQYQSVRPPVVQEHPHTPTITAWCYWCDTERRVRGQDPDFDRDDTQPHQCALEDDDDNTAARN